MLWTVMLKEGKQIFSDKGFLLIALLQPIVFIVMFGSSFQAGDINHLDTIVVDEDNSIFSRYVMDSTRNSEFFDVVEGEYTLKEALDKLEVSEVRSVVHIPKDFEKNINKKITGEIYIHIDSSNFLTYSSLSGAKVEVLKDTLHSVTGDILTELEEEKEKGRKQIEEIKDIFKDIEYSSEVLKEDFDVIKEDYENLDLEEIESEIDRLEDAIDEQISTVNRVEDSFDNLIFVLNGTQTVNESEEAKKQALIDELISFREDFEGTSEELEDILDELEDYSVVDSFDDDLLDDIQTRFNYINSMFEIADKRSKEVNFDFEKLEKKFLSEPLKIIEEKNHGPIKYFDYLGAGVLSLIVFFVCLMAPALNIISEKEKNTLYRLSTTPVSSLIVFLGKFMVFIIFGFFEMIYTLSLSILLYDIRITGSIFAVIFILTLLACASISIGLFISSRVRTMQQALVIVPLIVIPSFMISHSFFPPDIMAPFMNYVAYVTPMTFSNHALNGIMIKGFSLMEVSKDIYFLLAYTLIPLLLFIISFKRIRY